MGREKLQSATAGQEKRLRREARAEKAQRAEARSMETQPKERSPLSIKLKLTLWFTAFMAILAAACLGIILLISQSVARNEARQVLTLSVRANIPEVSLEKGRLSLSPDFNFYTNNVSMLLYNQDMALLSGQVPPSFPVNTPAENGSFRLVDDGNDGYYILDFWIPSGWEDGVWLRGVLANPGGSQSVGNIFAIFSIVLPFLILAAALGGYWIVKGALAPISRIAETAEAISGGQDLTSRIGVPGRGSGSLEVNRLASAFDHMFERLEQSFEAEKQFTSDASHELRTPVSVILAQCNFVEKHGDGLEDYQEAIQVIDRQAKNMSLLIERLLDMTRLDLGTQKLRVERVNLSEMCAVLCEEQDTGTRGISIFPEIEDGITVSGDQLLLARVIGNLLDNARKYGKENGHIFLRLYRRQDLAVLEVEDDGIGIRPEKLEKIWQRFYQADDARGSGSGLGLGLSMVRQIVKLHGGDVSVESAAGKGSRFTVVLALDQAG